MRAVNTGNARLLGLGGWTFPAFSIFYLSVEAIRLLSGGHYNTAEERRKRGI
jgi:hypothetical protein